MPVATTLGCDSADALAAVALERLESDAFADRGRVGYRFRVRNPDGDVLVEQQAYLSERDGRISWMRALCSGYRPVPAPDRMQ